mmetsp:Transcript_12129/g.18338  ORF Transcript_12129/g.18338 Transcript_12129/m.18338 type:complete len:302 (-) Transcript_12129:54-959(-)
MPPSKLSNSERIRRKREAARLRQQRCRARKRKELAQVKRREQEAKSFSRETSKPSPIRNPRTSSDLSNKTRKYEYSIETSHGKKQCYAEKAWQTACRASFHISKQDVSHFPLHDRLVVSRTPTRNGFNSKGTQPPPYMNKPLASYPSTPLSVKSAFLSPRSVSNFSSANNLCQSPKIPCNGSLIPRLNWKPRSDKPFQSNSNGAFRPPLPLESSHTFNEHEMTAVDAMLSLRHSPVSVVAKSRIIDMSTKRNQCIKAHKVLLPKIDHSMSVQVEHENQRRNSMFEHAAEENLKPGLHLFYN